MSSHLKKRRPQNTQYVSVMLDLSKMRNSPHDQSTLERRTNRDRMTGWRLWQADSGGPGTSYLDHTVCRPLRTRDPCRPLTLHDPHWTHTNNSSVLHTNTAKVTFNTTLLTQTLAIFSGTLRSNCQTTTCECQHCDIQSSESAVLKTLERISSYNSKLRI